MSALVWIEFRENSMHLLERGQGMELPVARDAAGQILPDCVDRLREALRAFSGRQAHCAIPARGVSLRTLSLPTAVPEEIARILPLQMEAIFPLAPSELAWGYSASPGTNGILVAAVKREVLNDYRSLLASAGLDATFTVSALARCALAKNPPPSFSFLDADQPRSELISFDSSGQARLRSLPTGEFGAELFNDKVFLTHRGDAAARLGLNGAAERIEISASPGHTAATLGLKKLCEEFGAPPLALQIPQDVAEIQATPQLWKWPALAAALLLAFLAIRALEPALQTPRLAKRLAEIQRYRDSLPAIERELAFLQYFKSNQPPFLEAVAALAGAAPQGTRFESISMARRGELTVRGSMGNPQGATEFRAKLVDSGLFAKLVLEEQTPDPNGQKLTFRLSAQMNPEEARKPRRDTNHAKSN